MDVLCVEGKFDGSWFNLEDVMGKLCCVWVEWVCGEMVEFVGRVIYVSLC